MSLIRAELIYVAEDEIVRNFICYTLAKSMNSKVGYSSKRSISLSTLIQGDIECVLHGPQHREMVGCQRTFSTQWNLCHGCWRLCWSWGCWRLLLVALLVEVAASVASCAASWGCCFCWLTTVDWCVFSIFLVFIVTKFRGYSHVSGGNIRSNFWLVNIINPN